MGIINYSDQGSGTPVVLIHGFCESNIIWKHLSSHLSAYCRVLCPDLPGFGKSKALEIDDFSLDDVATSLQEWLTDLGVSRCVMIGHSLGGYVTLAFADKFTDSISGLGLFHSSCLADDEEKKNIRNKVVQFLKTHGANEFTDTFIPGLFYHRDRQIEQDIEMLVEDARSCRSESLINYTKAMRDRPDRCHLLENQFPTLFIAGENDTAVPITASRKQSNQLSPENVHFLSETGHMGMFERKSETTQIVSDFLSQF